MKINENGGGDTLIFCLHDWLIDLFIFSLLLNSSFALIKIE